MLGFFDRLAFSHATELAGELMQAYLAEEVDEVHLITTSSGRWPCSA